MRAPYPPASLRAYSRAASDWPVAQIRGHDDGLDAGCQAHGKNMSNFDQRGNSILEEIHKNNINVYYVGDASTNNFSVYSEERDL
jgi:hypothetical protein